MSKNLIASLVSFPKLKRAIFLALILHGCFIASAQDSLRPQKLVHGAESQLSITRFDLFHSVSYHAKLDRMQFFGGLGYGVNRSLFQQRLFPKLSFLGVYSVIRKSKFTLGPSLQYSFSWLKINASTNHFTHWNEFFGGIHWNYGKKWKIGQTISAGYFTESYFNQIKQQRVKVHNWGYCLNLSIIYEL